MAIKLRVNQATALTYNEMDRNFSSFFYSASVDGGNFLKLWYTGSADLNTGTENYEPHAVTIDLNPAEGQNPTLIVAGTERSIQYKEGNILGASSDFIYSNSGFLGVGLGSPSTKIHAKGTSTAPATLRLESISTNNINRKANVEFFQGNTFYGSIGREEYATDNLYIKTYNGTTPGNLIINIGNNPHSAAFTTTGLGVGTSSPSRALHIVGEGYLTGKLGVGALANGEALHVYQNTQLQATSGEYVHIAKFGITPLANSTFLNVTAVRTSGGSDWLTEGMRIQNLIDSSYKSYIQFNGHDNLNGFSIGTGNADVSDVYTEYNSVPERFRITGEGKIGINTKTPPERLTVEGNISGSGTLQVNTLEEGSAATTSAVVATSAGLFQKIDAAPIPKGGIIMWSGTIIPAGWSLCNGENGTPNLQDKFIVGAGNTYAVSDTGGSKDAVLVAHEHTLTINQNNHGHPFTTSHESGGNKDTNGWPGVDFSPPVVYHNPNTGEPTRMYSNTATGNAIGGAKADILITSRADKTGLTAAGTPSTTQTGENANLPPYYALAFIMYGGI